MLYTIISSIGRGCAAFSQKASESAGRESIRPAQAIAPALSHFALQPVSSTQVTQPSKSRNLLAEMRGLLAINCVHFCGNSAS
jgi:hypothetical protein